MAKTILMIKSDYLKFLKRNEVAGKPIVDKLGKLNKLYLPLSEWLYKLYKKDNKLKIIGLSGGQGAGKSTITSILKFILKKKYGLELCIFSIDDFYKTKKQRVTMAKSIHPLFLTRGVPGTHDVNLINKTIKKLKRRKFKSFLIPKFDKSTDDRSKEKKWQKIKKVPDLVIFEGWCIGALPQKDADLKKPLNFIEKKYDNHLKWRKSVNNNLKNQYRKIFNKLDKLVYLKVPNFNYIYKWRLLQEKKLKLTSKSKKTMSKSQIKEFIMYYERITKHMMKNSYKISDLIIYLDKDHRSKKIKSND